MRTDYSGCLIAVADDSPVTRSVIPAAHRSRKTAAVLQYEMLAAHPYVFTQEDLLFASWLQGQDIPTDSDAEVARLRGEFFAKPQACLRASPLPKKYGWGLRFDDQGRVALCPMESQEYRDLIQGAGVQVIKALRSSRA